MNTPHGRIEVINVAMIGVACLLAHAFPYRLLMFSYAVLGPAHYLTQVSWLHDRRYFSGSSVLLPAMGLITVLMMVPIWVPGLAQPWFEASLLSVAASLALMVTVPRKSAFLAASVVAGVVAVCIVTRCHGAALFVAVLLPTVVHIFVFTVTFMLVGAIRTRSLLAYLSILALFACAASFRVPCAQLAIDVAVPHPAVEIFQPVVDYLKTVGFSSATSAQLFGFLSFAYTYHYLNWFSKANVIRWNHMPRARREGIVIVYAFAIAIYAFNFTAGFLITLLLSNLHVLLEFPLNLRTFATLASWRK